MTRPILVLTAALAAGLASQTIAASAQPADACLSVASAKYSQWAAPRMMIQETQTFADGTSRQIEAVFTEDSAYAHVVGRPWMTVNHSRGQRNAAAPDRLVKSMGLTDCAVVGSGRDGRQPVSIYSYDYMPDENAGHVSGKIWVSDATSLPVRQELNQEMEPGHHHVPVAISARFFYGDDVQVPTGARRADELRRFWTAEHFNLGAPVGGVGLGLPPTSVGAAMHH
jgi:hypothetical protein